MGKKRIIKAYTDKAGSSVGVENLSIESNLSIGNVTTVNQYNETITTKSADYTILDDDYISNLQVNTSGGNVTITLPLAANNNNRIITITKSDSNNLLSVVGPIEGLATTKLIDKYESITVISNGSEWYIKSANWAYGFGTPSISNTYNFSGSTATIRWTRISAQMVSVVGRMVGTASGQQAAFDIPIPLDSGTAFNNVSDALGAAGYGPGTNSNGGHTSRSGSNSIRVIWTAASGNASGVIHFQCMYLIK